MQELEMSLTINLSLVLFILNQDPDILQCYLFIICIPKKFNVKWFCNKLSISSKIGGILMRKSLFKILSKMFIEWNPIYQDETLSKWRIDFITCYWRTDRVTGRLTEWWTPGIARVAIFATKKNFYFTTQLCVLVNLYFKPKITLS